MLTLESLTFPHSTLDLGGFIHYSVLPSPLTVLTVKSFPRFCPALWACLLPPPAVPSWMPSRQLNHADLSATHQSVLLLHCLYWWFSVLPTKLDTQSCCWQSSATTAHKYLYTLSLLQCPPHGFHPGSCISHWIWCNHFLIGLDPQSWPTPSQSSLHPSLHAFFFNTIKIPLCHLPTEKALGSFPELTIRSRL